MNEQVLRRSWELSSETIAGIIGVVSVVTTTFVAGLWKWLSGKKKADAEAQVTLVPGFIALLAEMKADREALIRRINALEENNLKQDRHIFQLERLIIQHGIKIPEDIMNEVNNPIRTNTARRGSADA